MGKAESSAESEMSRQKQRWHLLDFRSLHELLLAPICDAARRMRLPGLVFSGDKRASSRSRSRSVTTTTKATAKKNSIW